MKKLLIALLFASIFGRATHAVPNPGTTLPPPLRGIVLYLVPQSMPTALGIQFQNQGTSLQTQYIGLATINCSTGMTCAWNGGTFTMTAAGSTGPSLVQFGSYLFYMSNSSACLGWSPTGTTVCARNNSTGTIDYSGPDAAVVINDVTTALARVGAFLDFKIGLYPILSMTLDQTSGCSSFEGSGAQLAYGIGFPANTTSTGVQWIIHGEGRTMWDGEAADMTVNNGGTIFYITPTAVSSVAAGDVLSDFWAQPNSSCALSWANSGQNDLKFENIQVRFPTNQRGNEVGIAAYFGGTVSYKNVGVDFNLSHNAIATGSAPVSGTWNLIGLTSTASGNGNLQDFSETYVTGYNLAYDLQSELATGETITGIYNNYLGEFGRSATSVFHPMIFRHVIDQENLNGFIFGPEMQQGSLIDITGYDVELGAANWYARSTGATIETTPGTTFGEIDYTAVKQGTGLVAMPALFTSGGEEFNTVTWWQGHLSQFAAADNFNRSNGAIGSNWANSQNTIVISSDTAIGGTASADNGAQWTANGYYGYQFAQAKLTGTANIAGVTIYGATGAYSNYACSDGPGSAKLTLEKFTSDSASEVVSEATSGWVSGEAVRLEGVPNVGGTGVLLTCYRLVGGVVTQTITETDSSSPYTSGAPGIYIYGNANMAVTYWAGGSFKIGQP